MYCRWALVLKEEENHMEKCTGGATLTPYHVLDRSIQFHLYQENIFNTMRKGGPKDIFIWLNLNKEKENYKHAKPKCSSFH